MSSSKSSRPRSEIDGSVTIRLRIPLRFHLLSLSRVTAILLGLLILHPQAIGGQESAVGATAGARPPVAAHVLKPVRVQYSRQSGGKDTQDRNDDLLVPATYLLLLALASTGRPTAGQRHKA
jgi:hypothetical protein